MIKDALGRSWQLGTIQVDYNLPERFQLEYIGSDNKAHRPVMIHRAPFGSMGGLFPSSSDTRQVSFHCGSPDQYMILPVSERFNDYAKGIQTELARYDIRGLVDERNESIGKKSAIQELKRIPYMLIIGDKEVEQNTISVREDKARATLALWRWTPL